VAVKRTNPPGRGVILYDGHCAFCARQARRLSWWARATELELRSFHDDGALEPFSCLTYADCMRALQLVTADGRTYEGMEAVVRVVAGRLVGRPALIYYVPGIRQLCDALYRLIARNRYRIAGRTCDDGTCHLHGAPGGGQPLDPTGS
jgi:predicted DCC family thiol-disulfide oxidoreductase YuxK